MGSLGMIVVSAIRLEESEPPPRRVLPDNEIRISQEGKCIKRSSGNSLKGSSPA